MTDQIVTLWEKSKNKCENWTWPEAPPSAHTLVCINIPWSVIHTFSGIWYVFGMLFHEKSVLIKNVLLRERWDDEIT